MNMHLIAVHVDVNDKPIGFRILDSDSGEVANYTYEQVLPVVRNNKAVIHGIEYDSNSKSLKGSNGTFQRYVNLFNNKSKNNSMIIIGTIENIGYRVSNFEGKMIDAYTKDVIDFATKVGIANGKIVDKEVKFISAISGKYDSIPLSKSTLKKQIVKNNNIIKQNNIKKDNYKDIEHSMYSTKIAHEIGDQASKLKEVDEKTGMTVEQKIAYTIKALNLVRPFYYSVYRCIKVVEANPTTIDTMGVSIDTLYFNSEFVKQISLGELLFVIIHEMNHIIMKHKIRQQNRNHEIWNCACDYYINKAIVEDFNIESSGVVTIVDSVIKDCTQKFEIVLPNMVLYNSKINIHKDTPESIYNELYNEKDSQQNQQGQNQQGQGQQGQNQQGQGQQGQGQQGQGQQGQGQQGQGQQGQGQQGQGQNQQGQGQQGQGQNQQGQQGQCVGREGQLEGQTFRGQTIGKVDYDIVDDNNSIGESSESLEQKGDALLRRIVTVHKQSHSFGGDNANWIERYIEKELAPKVDWRNILKTKLNRLTQKINTFSAPDKRFRSRGMIMPGPKNLDNDALENVKVCIDTSGSISPKDLGIALTQIEQLLRIYKAKAELLYWDTRVRAVYEFEEIDDIINKKPIGGGGTDANCIFEHFETDRDYKIGKKAKPSVIIVFTDGYFGEVNKRYSKYRDTIWVIAGDDNFVAPFGSKAPFKIEN